MKNFLFDYRLKIKKSFKDILKGREELRVVIRWWGFIAYLFFYFIVNKIVRINSIEIIDLVLSSFAVIYFSWHIFALKKCEPKKKKISKEEKKKLRQEKIRNLPKSFLRKLFLQEPISKWNTVHVLIALDLFYIVVFFDYILE